VLGRLKNQDELDKLIDAWTIHHTKYEVMNLLQQANIAAAAVLNNADVYNDPHIRERGFLDVIEDPDAGKRSHSPCLGEHNEYVLKKIAGLTSDKILELEREGVIGTTPVV